MKFPPKFVTSDCQLHGNIWEWQQLSHKAVGQVNWLSEVSTCIARKRSSCIFSRQTSKLYVAFRLAQKQYTKLHGMGFRGWVAASKQYFTKCNARGQNRWCETRCHWTGGKWRRALWSDKWYFSMRKSDVLVRHLSDCIVCLRVERFVEWGLWFGVVIQELSLGNAIEEKCEFFNITGAFGKFNFPNVV